MNNSKTLVFCFDGTGNEPSDAGNFQEDESISNVLKLISSWAGHCAHSGVQAALMSQAVRSIHVNDEDAPSRYGTVPVLHHSVADRFAAVPSYRPPALRGLVFRLLSDDGETSRTTRGVSGLRAYVGPRRR